MNEDRPNWKIWTEIGKSEDIQYICLCMSAYVCDEDSPVMGVAVFLGVVGPGPEHLGVEGIDLHEKL